MEFAQQDERPFDRTRPKFLLLGVRRESASEKQELGKEAKGPRKENG